VRKREREREREREERPRKVSQRRVKKAAGWTRGQGGARWLTGEAERRQGTHRGRGTWWLWTRRAMGVAWPALPPTWGGCGATVETIRIPRSKGERVKGWLRWVVQVK
jgi:hypothetical protein